MSPGSILARRREAKPAALVQSPALASPVPPVRGPAWSDSSGLLLIARRLGSEQMSPAV